MSRSGGGMSSLSHPVLTDAIRMLARPACPKDVVSAVIPRCCTDMLCTLALALSYLSRHPMNCSYPVASQAGDSRDRRVQSIAIQMVTKVAEASMQNCGKLAALGVGPLLCSIATGTSDSLSDRALRWNLCRQTHNPANSISNLEKASSREGQLHRVGMKLVQNNSISSST